MALRIRKDLTIVCAAKSKEQEGDVYIDDRLHYLLSIGMKVLHPIARDNNGAEIWVFDTTGNPMFQALRNSLEKYVKSLE